MKSVLKWTAIVLAGFGALSNVPALIFGLSFIREWVEVHTSHGPYFRWSYFAAGLVCILLSASGLELAARAVRGKRFRTAASFVSLLLGLACMVQLPDVGPQLAMEATNMRILGHADHSLSDWDESHGRFPTNEDELRKALGVRPLQETAIYFRRGRPIPYDLRIETRAFGPSEATVPPNPGTLVYAVSSDYKEYWLTMTTLKDPVVGPVVWVWGLEPIWVMHRKHHNPGEGYQGLID